MRVIAPAILLLSLLAATGCKPGLAYRMPTEGMLPTIGRNDLCIANPAAYAFSDVERFDLVVFRPNEELIKRYNDPGLLYLMRAVGLPGEKVEIRENELYINDRLIKEPYDKFTDSGDRKRNFGPVVMGNDEYFILGDNRPNSEDSRYWAKPTVAKTQIVSKIVSVEKDYYK